MVHGGCIISAEYIIRSCFLP